VGGLVAGADNGLGGCGRGGGKRRGGGSAEGGGGRKEAERLGRRKRALLMCKGKGIGNKCSRRSCPKTRIYKQAQIRRDSDFRSGKPRNKVRSQISLVPAARPALCFYSLWEELVEELRIMSLSHVWVAPADSDVRELSNLSFKRGLAHLMRPIRDTCPEHSCPYSP
jgi:hypothetical protein